MLFKRFQALLQDRSLQTRKTARLHFCCQAVQKQLNHSFPKESQNCEAIIGCLVMGCFCSRGGNSGEAEPVPDPQEPKTGDPDAPKPSEPVPEEPKSSKNIVPDLPAPRRVVAFTAKLNPAHSTPYHRGVLKLVDVLANEGDAYSPDTGIFTCPLEGLYHFTVHMSVCGRAQCAIFKNGESLASVYHTSLPNKCCQVASISSTALLSEGDTVWVNLWGHGRHEIIATEDNDTVFVGFYLG